MVEFAGPDNIRLRGLYDERQFAVCFPVSDVLDLSNPVVELAQSPIHARLTVAGAYEVAFLSSDLRPRLVVAHPDEKLC